MKSGHRIDNPVTRPEERLYPIPRAAKYLGRTVWALREMIWAGKLPIVRDGRRILLDVEDLDRWIEQNKTQEVVI